MEFTYSLFEFSLHIMQAYTKAISILMKIEEHDYVNMLLESTFPQMLMFKGIENALLRISYVKS